MRKEIKIYSAVIILSMLAFIYMACIQRASWHEVIINQELLDGYQIMNSVDFTTKQAAPSLSELVGESQIIVEVEGTDNHEELEYTILSEVRVKKVYKGDDLLVDKVIFIYELFYINNNNSYVISDGGYMLMQPNTSYILFLNFYEKPEGYKYTEKDKNTYLLSKVHFGKYSTFVEQNTKLYDPDPETNDYLLYKQVKGYDF